MMKLWLYVFMTIFLMGSIECIWPCPHACLHAQLSLVYITWSHYFWFPCKFIKSFFLYYLSSHWNSTTSLFYICSRLFYFEAWSISAQRTGARLFPLGGWAPVTCGIPVCPLVALRVSGLLRLFLRRWARSAWRSPMALLRWVGAMQLLPWGSPMRFFLCGFLHML